MKYSNGSILSALVIASLALSACDSHTIVSRDIPPNTHTPLVAATPIAQHIDRVPETAQEARDAAVTEISDAHFVMPQSKAECVEQEGYCLYDTGFRPTSPNRNLDSLTAAEADTDGAGCLAIDSRGRTVASLVPNGPVKFRYHGRLYVLPQSQPPLDHKYFTNYGSDDLSFGFKDGDEVAQGVENRAYQATAQLLIDRQLLSTQVRLECGA